MLGAVAGDIIGSFYECSEQKRYDFELLPHSWLFTRNRSLLIIV